MALCYPDSAIWPDPSVVPVEPENEEDLPAYELAQQQVEIALGLAWTTLQVLSAYQIAICPITIRPCKQSCAQGTYYVAPVMAAPGYAPFWPNVRNGQWTNVWCGHNTECSCTTIQQVTLLGPVGGVESVVIDGVELDPTAYRVDNGSKLVRQDGGQWPVCQDMNAPAGEIGTFTVTYYHGATADITVRYAAGVLAAEYLAAMLGGECRLPSGTTAIVRQGLTIEAREDFFETGTTGIHEVDSVIRRFNPYGQRMAPKVYSLDAARPRVKTVGM